LRQTLKNVQLSVKLNLIKIQVSLATGKQRKTAVGSTRFILVFIRENTGNLTKLPVVFKSSVADPNPNPNPKEAEAFCWIRIRKKFGFEFGFGSNHERG
jgi:hypothetical protein